MLQGRAALGHFRVLNRKDAESGWRRIMIETIIEMELAVGEKVLVRRNRILPQNQKESGKRISIVSGIHGDELEGQYVCYEVARRIAGQPELLHGIVDIYPALNPLGLESAHRTIPKMEMDMNRMFPGNKNGNMMERAAAAIVDSLTGSDICVDVHASDMQVREIPQVRVSEEFAERMLPFARLMNVDMIWMNATATVHESTLAHSMNMLGVPTLVVEMGLGMRISRKYGNQVADGIFNLMKEMGIWEGEVKQTQFPVISTDGEVEFIRADHTGVFLPCIEHNHYVCKGDLIGQVVNTYTGQIKQEIVAQKNGLVFTLREYPMVYEGALLARILTDIKEESKEDNNPANY